MNSVTKDYLAEIIFKKASENIDQYRESKQQQFDNEPYPGATDEEVLDFIITIPYFDVKLKDFCRVTWPKLPSSSARAGKMNL